MTVSVCPTFFCGNRCGYCYLGDLTERKDRLDLVVLDEKLRSLRDKFGMDGIELFGGDISALDDAYLTALRDVCGKYSENLNVITNVSRDISHIYGNWNISFSLNRERPDYGAVLEFIKKTRFEFSLNVVVLPSVVESFRSGEYVERLKNLPEKCRQIFFIKYSDSVASKAHYDVPDGDYEYVIKKAVEYFASAESDVSCRNLLDLRHGYDPRMSSGVFVLPSGKFAWIAYDENNREYFETGDAVEDYEKACEKESKIYIEKCSTCEFFGGCCAEHLNFNKKCSGHADLKRWFDENCLSETDEQMQS